MNTEFNWWLLIVGLSLGAGVVWLILSVTRRDEADVTDRERESEALWIGEAMRRAGREVADADALDILRLHELYLSGPPPDEVDEDILEPELFDNPARLTGRSPHLARAAGDGHPPAGHPIGSAETADPIARDR